MKIIKRIFIGLFLLISTILIAAIFIKKDMKTEKEIIINKPKQQVYDYLALLKNQDNFSPWAEKDLNMKKGFVGTDGAVGCYSTWDGNGEVGKGAQEIKALIPGQKIDLELRFEKPFNSKNHAYFITEQVSENATKVKWGFDGKAAYPLNFFNLFMDMGEVIGKDYNLGLAKLKTVLEK